MKSQTAIRGGSATVSDDGVFVESSTAAGNHSPNNRDTITNNFHLSSSQSSLLSTSSFSPKVKLETQTRLKYSFLPNKRPNKKVQKLIWLSMIISGMLHMYDLV